MKYTSIYEADFQKFLVSRYDNGADFWATSDGRIGIEKPISTLTALLIMSELRVSKTDETLNKAVELVLSKVKRDGRISIAPKGSIYPCHTALAAAALCRNGYAEEPRVKLMLNYLLSSRYDDGGWRCNKFIYGHGNETNHSNPGVTLFALDSIRSAGMNNNRDLDSAVETLLDHWTTKAPLGPCHFGIGKRFMKIEYPFLRYNLFYYAYILSFYPRVKKDERFLEVLGLLNEKLDDDNKIVVENSNMKLSELQFCKKGNASEAATERYIEIIRNLKS